MDEVVYIVDNADHGGWDKKHIWAVTKDDWHPSYGTAVPLCRNLKTKFVTYEWYVKLRKQVSPESDPKPLEEYPHFCMDCHSKWYHLVKEATKEQP